MTTAASSALGYVACVFFALLLAPQIYENYQRRSTDGLSLVMIAIWLTAGIGVAAYLFATDANVALLFQWHIVNTFCCVIAGQWYRYRPSAVAKAAIVAEVNRRAHVQAVNVRNADIQDGLGGVEDIHRSSSSLTVNGYANGHSNGVGGNKAMDIDSVPSTSASFTSSPNPLADVIVEPSIATDNAAAHINGISNGVVMKNDDLAIAVAATNGSNVGAHNGTTGVVGQSFGSLRPAIAFVLVWIIIYWLLCIILWQIFVAAKSTVIPLIFGSIVPSVLLVLGFVPQVALIRRLKSSQGFSRGLSMMDLSGCAISIAALAADETMDYVAAIPYAVVVICQSGMLILTTCIYPVSKPPVRYIAYDDDEAAAAKKPSSIATIHASSLEPRKLARDEVAERIGTANGDSSHDDVVSDINGVDGSDNVRQLARQQIKQTIAANGHINGTQRSNGGNKTVPGLR